MKLLVETATSQAAVTSDNRDIAELLIDRGVDVNESSHHFNPLLFVAVSNDDIEMAAFLLDKGADILSRNSTLEDVTVLHFAILHSSAEHMKLLTSRGADIEAKNSS